MTSAKNTGRIIGLLMVVQLSGLIVPFVLLHPLMGGTEAYLAAAAGYAFQIKVATLLLLANCAVTIGMSIVSYPVFRKYGSALALLLVALSVMMFVMQAVDNAQIMSMVALSHQYLLSGAQDETFQTLAAVAGVTRRWVHYPVLLVIDGWLFVLFGILYRFALVPRPLAAFGLATVVLHFAAITLPLFVGYPALMPLGAAMGLGQLAIAGWLIVKGYNDDKRETISGPTSLRAI